MASRLVEGVRLPLSLGGHPGIELCNTRAGWGAPRPKEYLASYEHLTRWAEVNGLIDAAAAERSLRLGDRRPRLAAELVHRTIELRGSLYAVLVEHDRGSSLRAVAAEAELARLAERLERADGAAPARWELRPDRALDLPLLAVARAAGDLVTDPLADKVSACPMPDCGWLFENVHGRRRWCSMAWCGNRTKVRRHAAAVRTARRATTA